MCRSNTPELVCGKRIAQIIAGKGAETRIPWCGFTIRRILQLISAFRLTPDNLETQIISCPTPDSVAVERNAFDLIAAEVHCHHPSNPQFAPAVRPRLARKIRRMMEELDERGVVVIYKMPKGGERRVYWPPWTRGWCRADWDSDYGGVVEGGVREVLGRVAEGGEVPGFVAEGGEVPGFVAEGEGELAAGVGGGMRQPIAPLRMPMQPVAPLRMSMPARMDLPTRTGMPVVAQARAELPTRMERSVMPTLARAVVDPRLADDWDAVSGITTDSTVTTDSEMARLDSLMARVVGGQQQQQGYQPQLQQPEQSRAQPGHGQQGHYQPPQQQQPSSSPFPLRPSHHQLQQPQQQAPPGQGTSKSAKRRLKRRLRGGLDGEDAEMES